MYRNLKDELRKKNMGTKEYAEFLDVSESTANNKINQTTEFTLPEYKKTCKFLFPEYNPDYLFATE